MVFIILWRIRIIYQSFTIFFFLRQIIVKYFKRSKLIFQKIIAKDIINNTINVAKILKEKKKKEKDHIGMKRSKRSSKMKTNDRHNLKKKKRKENESKHP